MFGRVVILIVCHTLAVVLLLATHAAGQDVTEPALKAAFILSFAKFTEWPADALPAAKPLVLCVLGDDAVGAELERVVKARVIDGRKPDRRLCRRRCAVRLPGPVRVGHAVHSGIAGHGQPA